MASKRQREDGVLTLCSALLVVGVLLGSVTPARAVDVRILLIGSSHSAGIKPKLQSILDSVGRTYTITAKSCSGCSLAEHAAKSTTLSAIDEGWDWVILQDDAREHFEYVGWDAANLLRDRALAANPAGDVMFYMLFSQLPAFTTQPPYYGYELARLRHDECLDQDVCPLQSTPAGCLGTCYGYAAIGHQMGMRIAPVGQSVVDFHEESGLPISSIFGSGGGHLNDKGDYLAALTIYTTIYENLPESVWAPSGLTPTQASTYKSIARNAVLREPTVWNLWNETVTTVATAADDARLAGGTTTVFSSETTLRWLSGSDEIGVRFQGVAVPKNATILSARIEGALVNGSSGVAYGTSFMLVPQSTPPFTLSTDWASQCLPNGTCGYGFQSIFTAGVPVGTYVAIADAKAALQYLVGMSTWQAGTSVTSIIRGAGPVTLSAFDASNGKPPRLVVRYR